MQAVSTKVPAPGMHKVSRQPLALLALLLACGVAAAAALQPATCKIDIRGNGPDEEGVKAASIQCSGSGFSMAVSPALGNFEKQFQGIEWDSDSCGKLDCLITFCGSSNVVIRHSSILRVNSEASTGMICVTGKSRVTIIDSTLGGNKAENGTLHLRDKAQAAVINSVIRDATGVRGGGAQLDGVSILRSVNSTWSGNEAEFGAAMNVRGNSTLWISNGTVLDSNYVSSEYNYGPGGGAVYCRANGKVYVHNHNTFVNNQADGYDSAGGAIFCQDDCVVDIKRRQV